MFFLIFNVMFNLKKGSNLIYCNNWFFSPQTTLYSILPNTTTKYIKTSDITLNYQFTAITSRTTTYFLFIFWVFFFFYGETLILLLFNFTTVIDIIPSASFIVIKQHLIFALTASSFKLTSILTFYIFFLTLSAATYLINLNFIYSYAYFKQSTLNSIILMFYVVLYIINTSTYAL